MGRWEQAWVPFYLGIGRCMSSRDGAWVGRVMGNASEDFIIGEEGMGEVVR